jgi:UDP-N-acetylmuramate dehydrogenase
MTASIVDALTAALGADAVLQGVALSEYTTFKIGGPAEVLVQPRSIEGVRASVEACVSAGIEWRVMGLGSDLLIADEGLPGATIRLGENLSEVSVSGNEVIALAGASNEQVAEAAAQAGLAGYEFASGIPGSIGGAAIMNAGAYGGEFKDVAVEVLCLTRAGELVCVGASEADWGYRHSMMSDQGMVVLQAKLLLQPDDRGAIRSRMDDLAQRRSEKQPLEMPSAGSTFKRPEGYFAGKLIQEAGLQGYGVGGAQVSTKHAGFVVNAGGATASDVRQLIRDVQDRVLAEAGVRLEPEVRMWGFAD